jgi:lysozyme
MKALKTLGLTALLICAPYNPVSAQTSQTGIDLIKNFEKYSPTNYLCQAKKPTIGYGHVIKKGESFSWIDKKTAEDMLRKDVKIAESFVEDNVKIALTQSQYDALTSFVYNIGGTAFKNSTLLTKINSGDYSGAAEQFDRWVFVGGEKSNGLIRRRAAEKELFLRK